MPALPHAQAQAHRPAAGSAAPWFFDTPQQRLAWARRRFFEDGVRPTGLVSEAVLQSWARCVQAGMAPQHVPAFNPVSASRVHSLLARHQPLLHAASAELAMLQQALAGTAAVAALLDPDGVVLRASHRPDATHMPLLARALRPGVDLSEACIGTNAPALATRRSGPCTVPGATHFANALQHVHCAAAAVHGPDGRVAAVLDLSTEGQPFGFDAETVVGWYATAIENQWLLADARAPLVLRLHLQPAQIDSALVGLLGVQADGRVAWLNAAAAAVLGPVPAGMEAEQVLGLPLPALLQWARTGRMQARQLPNGLRVWLQGEWHAHPQGAGSHLAPALAATPASAPVPASTPADSTAQTTPTAGFEPQDRLRDRHRMLVLQALRACGGNVSAAARALGVSRGLIYRHRGPPCPD